MRDLLSTNIKTYQHNLDYKYEIGLTSNNLTWLKNKTG